MSYILNSSPLELSKAGGGATGFPCKFQTSDSQLRILNRRAEYTILLPLWEFCSHTSPKSKLSSNERARCRLWRRSIGLVVFFQLLELRCCKSFRSFGSRIEAWLTCSQSCCPPSWRTHASLEQWIRPVAADHWHRAYNCLRSLGVERCQDSHGSKGALSRPENHWNDLLTFVCSWHELLFPH